MEKSLVLILPDKPGALRRVTRLLSNEGLSILRVSYNRVVDMHTLFVDVTGTRAEIASAEAKLHEHRLFPGERDLGEVRLLELELADEVGALDPVLRLLEHHRLNITTVDVRTDVEGPGLVRVGVHVDSEAQLQALIDEASAICPVRLVERDESFAVNDNATFCIDFARVISNKVGFDSMQEHLLLVNANRIMQNLTGSGADPYKPFDYLGQMAEMITASRGPAYLEQTRVSRFETALGAQGVSVEPPVGCTTWVLEADDCLLVFDAGFRCYADELDTVLQTTIPDWDRRRRVLAITHADIDHVGDSERFDQIWASGRVIDNFQFESMGIVNWREQNSLGMPYNFICKELASYRTPDWAHMGCLGEPSPFGEQDELLRRIDTLEVAPFSFEVWEGKGGHIRGETVYVERAHRLCVSGDIIVNVHGETKPQMRYNALAPYLLTSVDIDPQLARRERTELLRLLGPGRWQILGGHGCLMERDLGVTAG